MVLILSCSAAGNSVSGQNTSNQVKTAPQVLFINLTMDKDEASQVKAELINKIITNGRIKGKKDSSYRIENAEYLCVQYDQKSTPLDSLIMDDPFVKNVEYINSQGAFERKRIELDSSQVSLRMQLTDQTKYVGILHKNQIIAKIEL